MLVSLAIALSLLFFASLVVNVIQHFDIREWRRSCNLAWNERDSLSAGLATAETAKADLEAQVEELEAELFLAECDAEDAAEGRDNLYHAIAEHFEAMADAADRFAGDIHAVPDDECDEDCCEYCCECNR